MVWPPPPARPVPPMRCWPSSNAVHETSRSCLKMHYQCAASQPGRVRKRKARPDPGGLAYWMEDPGLVAPAAGNRHEAVDLALHDAGAGQDLVGEFANPV